MVEITKIKMTVEKHEIKMTLKQAKDFQKLLNGTFPDLQQPTIINPVIIEHIKDYPHRPYPYRGYEVTCDNTGTLSWSVPSR